VAVIGYGSGATVRAAATHPVEEIDVVELEPHLLEADPYFFFFNDQVLRDKRVRCLFEDGRTFLRFSNKAYDVIISEPSNPWMAGVGSLFTTDFYRLAASRLTEGGVFCQWIQLYEISSETLNVMLQTLSDTFPYVQLFTQDGDLICVASKTPQTASTSYMKVAFATPAIRSNLARIRVQNPFELFIGYLATFPEDSDRFAASGRNTDDNAWLEYRAPMEMYSGASASVSPLEFDRYLSRYEKNFFHGFSPDAIALGLAKAIVRLRPYAGFRIRGFLKAPLSPRAARQVELAAGEADMKWEKIQEATNIFGGILRALEEGRGAYVVKPLEKALEQQESNNTLWRMLGMAYVQAGRPNQARQALEKALSLYGEDYVSLSALAALDFQEGRHEQGQRRLKMAKELYPLADHFVSTAVPSKN